MASGFSAHMLGLGATSMAAAATFMQIHSGDPGAAGTTSVASGTSRVACVIDHSGAALSLDAPVAFTGGTSGGTASWVSLWDASTSGNWLGNFQVTGGDTTFNAAGAINVTALDISGA